MTKPPFRYPAGQTPPRQGVPQPTGRNKLTRGSSRAVASPEVFLAALTANDIPVPHKEYRFDAHHTPQRRWRFDFCWPQYAVALEVEGGAWVRGRHTRGAGYIADLEKYSEAAAQGWLLIRVTPQQLCEERTLGWIRRAIDHIIQRAR